MQGRHRYKHSSMNAQHAVQSLFTSMKGRSFRELMKTKNFYLLILFLAAVFTTLWMLIDPSLHTIVSETHKQITNIKNIPSNLKNSVKDLLDVDVSRFEQLGFDEDEFVPIDAESLLKKDPVVVVPVEKSYFERAKTFLWSVKKYVPEKFVVFYDLGLSNGDAFMLRKTCNDTKNNCKVKLFNYNKYPIHVRYLTIKSYIPLCIQESLTEYGAVIWSNPSEYFIAKNLSNSLAIARKYGIAAWLDEKYPTSYLAHPKMFTYFNEIPKNYYFHTAVKPNHLIIYNTEKIHKEVMLEWVKCALTEECIKPIGAQETGCNYPPKPLYLYSGCHRNEMAALNVVLGKAFKYYAVYTTESEVFGIEKNVTASTGAS